MAPSSPDGRTPLTVIRLDPSRGTAEPAPDWITATITATIGNEPHQLEISVPEGPARLRELLPVFEGLTDVLVGVAERQVTRAGETISCKKGCGACCRQVVPVSAAEARHLAQLVAALPQPRRAQVLERFAAARRRLADAGMLGRLQTAGSEARPLGVAYFGLGIACPFLEEESCSIHADRPLACREYLVTSPAENCARPTPETVRCVEVPARVSIAVRELEKETSAGAPAWVPLVLALDWAAEHAEETPTATGPQLLPGVFAKLSASAAPAQGGEGQVAVDSRQPPP